MARFITSRSRIRRCGFTAKQTRNIFANDLSYFVSSQSWIGQTPSLIGKIPQNYVNIISMRAHGFKILFAVCSIFCLQRVLYLICSVLYILFAVCCIFCFQRVVYFVCSVFYILFAVCCTFCLQRALYFVCSALYILFAV